MSGSSVSQAVGRHLRLYIALDDGMDEIKKARIMGLTFQRAAPDRIGHDLFVCRENPRGPVFGAARRRHGQRARSRAPAIGRRALILFSLWVTSSERSAFTACPTARFARNAASDSASLSLSFCLVPCNGIRAMHRILRGALHIRETETFSILRRPLTRPAVNSAVPAQPRRAPRPSYPALPCGPAPIPVADLRPEPVGDQAGICVSACLLGLIPQARETLRGGIFVNG